MDVTAYLDRIGADDPGLRELSRAHQRAVPFENLSIHLGETISLDPDALFDKVVRRRRGGFCYELNGLFALLLEELGHTVDRVACRVHRGDGVFGPLFDHLALIVDGEWLVDVGFGRHTIYPLRLGDRADQVDPEGRFRLVDAPDGDIVVLRAGEPQYRLERRARPLTDFAPACWWQQTWPESQFRRAPVCTRLDGDTRITLSRRTLLRTVGGDRVETELTSDADLLAAYRTHFGIELDRPIG
ncbi:N-acetyltransferase [Actinoplanes sp. SE50]|uniref:arylamine N-acetyltransferase family protein n=1 Tax=unclassified Actinoplanes TaxID=2626549 RepID=UPI00023EC82B|nr:MULTISPECIES: arylamine N-acetyltransferase [unclassified Actinoplanes]AEV85943.1 N-hydroxyarylamine O-acetyltransferase [Actinoplanes sp. SE50/110]ATO84339.1 N-acetyltransferase [Actinoplanes sp. SE50]SLM01749.1 N-acetyltransferase [Actinoplanes sp. SE50/110]